MAETESLVIDTTYLLPLFGLETNITNYDEKLPILLDKYDVKYNPISLLEAKWLIIRTAKKNKEKFETFLEYYREGIATMQREDRIHQTAFTDENIESLSDIILMTTNIKDYFDRQIYSTAANLGYILLTEDKQLHELRNYPITPKPKKVVYWKQITNM